MSAVCTAVLRPGTIQYEGVVNYLWLIFLWCAYGALMFLKAKNVTNKIRNYRCEMESLCGSVSDLWVILDVADEILNHASNSLLKRRVGNTKFVKRLDLRMS